MTKVNRVRRPNHWGRSSRREVMFSPYWWIRRKPSPRRAWNRPAPTCPAELTRPVIPKQADEFTCYRVLVGGLDVRPRRGVGEGRDAGEPELGEQRLAGGGGAGEFLVVVIEVGSNASMASSRTEMPRELICAGRPERRGRVSTRVGVSGWNFTVPVGLVAGPAGAGRGTG